MRTFLLMLVTAAVTYILCRRPKQPARRLVITKVEFHDTGHIIKGDLSMVRLNPNQKVTITAAPADRHGRPANIEPGSARWELSDPSIGTITQNPDNELEAEVVSSATLGEAIAKVTADGRPGEGDVPITGVVTVVVAPEDAVVFGLSGGTPTDV